MKRYTVLLVIVLSALVAGGCGATPATNSKAATTTKQVASIMARPKQEILDAIAYEDRCSGGECMFAANVMARYQKIADMAANLNQELEASKPVDKEVTDLVAQTQTTLGNVTTTWTAFRSCVTSAGGHIFDCSSEWSANEKAWRAMKPMFAAWSPYGV